uniref:Uncharacterized protein n=1 Tax=Rhodosorus marinus TaxID=101924 RepID=A0A7S3A4B8_9RHOD|mmetsp:Transcript_44317/g.172426  ORF Transcript_44317/g.172426 Transcript_44317/m.172426 type:complete len:279 (+) Transcript_44317:205-1041(+)
MEQGLFCFRASVSRSVSKALQCRGLARSNLSGSGPPYASTILVISSYSARLGDLEKFLKSFGLKQLVKVPDRGTVFARFSSLEDSKAALAALPRAAFWKARSKGKKGSQEPEPPNVNFSYIPEYSFVESKDAKGDTARRKAFSSDFRAQIQQLLRDGSMPYLEREKYDPERLVLSPRMLADTRPTELTIPENNRSYKLIRQKLTDNSQVESVDRAILQDEEASFERNLEALDDVKNAEEVEEEDDASEKYWERRHRGEEKEQRYLRRKQEQLRLVRDS